jgi:hypothetical protein
MPFFLHNADQVWCRQSHTEWLLSGQLTRNESRMLHVTADSGKAMHLRSFPLIQF